MNIFVFGFDSFQFFYMILETVSYMHVLYFIFLLGGPIANVANVADLRRQLDHVHGDIFFALGTKFKG